MSQDEGRGFLDAAASAFLRRRLHHQRLRAAAVRGLKTVSTGAGGRLQMEFDRATDGFAHLPSWLADHTSEMAAAPATDEAASDWSDASCPPCLALAWAAPSPSVAVTR